MMVVVNRCELLEKGVRDDPVTDDGRQSTAKDASSIMDDCLAFEIPEVELRLRWFNCFSFSE
jgi:hypothetical protein